ncbi:hypothetical protein GN956_G9041 [Arapaima gigas]
MSPPWVGVARRHLASGRNRTRLSATECLSLAAQVRAVDSGLKPALLYDSNSVGPDQVRSYLCELQELGFVSRQLHLLVIDHSVLIVNLQLSIIHLEELLLHRMSVVVVDVGQQRTHPAVVDLESTGLDKAVQGMLANLRELVQSSQSDGPLVHTLDIELLGNWNLCSLFGVLLGYPVTYWFNPQNNAANCLGMVPLQVTRVSALCKPISGSNRCYLYTFSVPQGLESVTRAARDLWAQRLRDVFDQQSTFAELSVSLETVCLPCVALSEELSEWPGVVNIFWN